MKNAGDGHVRNRITLPDEWKNLNSNEQDLLVELLDCAKLVEDHLGRIALGVLYESLLLPVEHPVPALVACLARIMDVGYISSRVAAETGHMGVDVVRSKTRESNQRQRMFSFHITQALQALSSKAGGWDNILQIISKYASLLSLQGNSVSSGTGNTRRYPCSLPKKLLSQSTSQIAWDHFKAARNLWLLLIYSVEVGAQVCSLTLSFSFSDC